MELLQNINAPLRKLCNSMFFANKKIMVAIMRSTKTNAMEAIMKKFMGIATAAVFGLGIFTTSAKAETIVTTDVLNVRENPTTESKVVGKLLDGYKVNVLHTENGWSKVKLNSGKEAFISADYTKDTYYVTANVLNVRAGANTDSEILGKLKQDDVIETTHQVENDWIQFEYNGKTAYVHVPYLTGKAPVKVQPAVKVEKTTKVQDTAKTVAATKAREVAETQAKAQEATKAREAAEAQAEAKAEEAAKAREAAKAQEAAKAREAAEAQAEAKAQEAAKAREAAKAQEAAEAQAAAKAQEAAKAREAAKAQEAAEAQAAAKAQEAAKAREAAKAQKPATQQPVAKETETSAPSSSRELRVVATAYTADPLENGYKAGDQVKSAMGHNLTANPNMKLIAVDPSVIPLGSKVWVEGYGVAIAGDTGGAIKGNKIDVLMPDKGTSSNWGRKTVTVKVLN
ncbi:cell wall-binding protein EntC [Bacillus cereus]|uniref:cell wall-binding protein EntC n=1 Tax=Bacillus cereus TaxID=1396 RepID=UPI002405F410|nr:cell wall-binding protein EntC [Bacillus cereus]MCU4796463.1 cell wall-binding protein EntC [Bacillus cereus]MDF9478765.1 cell wall-binding protein EntC [Bacillus cereus]MDF9500343.1 cell wall-binding protein EntC [Bacillus cereus]MDF9514064.1 cell wall-binding protein EntC [Bacillus cereus]MDF9569485.1 cell wall-binding protein EntC [Bacillus cereus]